MLRPKVLQRLAPPVALLACCLSSCTGGGTHEQAVDGTAGAGDRLFPGAGNGGYDVTHYGLDLTYDPASGRLAGTAAVAATATERLGRFNLDFAGMTVGSVDVGGRPASFSRSGNELTVRPARPLARGARFTATVAYAGVPGTLTDPDGSKEGWLRTADGAVALGEPVGAMAWFPCNNHPSDKAPFDLTVSVPSGLTAVSNGELAGTTQSGGRTAFHWHTARPMATYLATVAIGHFTVSHSATPGGLPIYTAVDPRSDDPGTAAALRRIPEILDWESGLYGPYPFASGGAIVAHLTGSEGGYALETQNRPFFPGAAQPPAVPVNTLVHEMSHQWVGDSVTPRSWQDIWLNEGFATYTEWLWAAHEGGDSLATSATAAFDESAAWKFPPASPPTAADLFASPVYERGALVLYELQRALGDAEFFRLLRAWPAQHAYGNASTADFTAFCAQFTHRDLTPLFSTWLYGSAKPAHL